MQATWLAILSQTNVTILEQQPTNNMQSRFILYLYTLLRTTVENVVNSNSLTSDVRPSAHHISNSINRMLEIARRISSYHFLFRCHHFFPEVISIFIFHLSFNKLDIIKVTLLHFLLFDIYAYRYHTIHIYLKGNMLDAVLIALRNIGILSENKVYHYQSYLWIPFH